jgi:hypothetical protein
MAPSLRQAAREEKRRAIALDAASRSPVGADMLDMIGAMSIVEPFNLPRASQLRARDILAAIDPRDVYQTGRATLTAATTIRRISCQG